MWLFKRKAKQTSDSPVPEEIKAYYQSENKDKLWKIWLLSGLTFLVTLIIVLGLFWVGRGVYRHYNKPTATTIKSGKTAEPSAPQTKQPQTDKDTSNNGAKPSPTPTPSPQTTQAPAANGSSNSAPLVDTGPGNVDL